MPEPKVIFRFDENVLDENRCELRRAGEVVAVEPQVFSVLLHLIRNRDRIVSRDDLIVGVWDGRVVSDSTLSSRITAVRHAIGDSGGRQRLIRTVPHKGYRFIGAVREGVSSEKQVSDRLAIRPPSDKPSVAILPFTNLSNDPEQDRFINGIVDDVIAALSRFRHLSVIARSICMSYRERGADAKQVALELGVR